MPGDRPVLHLTNAAIVNAMRRRGETPHHLTIQRYPSIERGECGKGAVRVLKPTESEWDIGARLVDARKRKRPADPADIAAYRDAMEARWRDVDLSPGALLAHMATGLCVPVPDGATLTCACSRDEAAAGRCHRAWAAPHLHRAGWHVWLDGVEVSDG